VSTVLVTDGEQRSALAITRSLGRAGHRVLVCSARRRSLAGASRYASERIRVHDPLTAPDAFIADVRAICERRHVKVLLPVTEAALRALLPARSLLDRVRIPFPGADAFAAVSDKRLVLAAASRLGIAVPEQCVLLDRAARDALDLAGLRFPLVLKPSRSVADRNGRRVKLGVQYASDPAELDAQLDALDDAAYPVLLQQRVIGPGTGIFLLLWKGELRAVFAHRRLREKPPSGGVSVYCESVAAEPELVDRSRALLREFDWCGVAMVEYKRDAITGTPYLMEVNGRFWGSLQLAIDAGVDFPRMLVECASGRPPTPVTSYRVGVRSRWFWGDVDHLIARLRHAPDRLSLPPDAPTRWEALRAFCSAHPLRQRGEVLRAEDPMPFVRETLQWLRRT
jgi:predicted ATP-grasp superfamily ATP-dependent carboligase